MARKINVKLIMELRDAGLKEAFITTMSVTLRNQRSIASSIRKSSRTRPCTVILIMSMYIRN